jgi:hypothetical protein
VEQVGCKKKLLGYLLSFGISFVDKNKKKCQQICHAAVTSAGNEQSGTG